MSDKCREDFEKSKEQAIWSKEACDFADSLDIEQMEQRMLAKQHYESWNAGAESRQQEIDQLVEALEISIDYVRIALDTYDDAFKGHPATGQSRKLIVADLEKCKEALAKYLEGKP